MGKDYYQRSGVNQARRTEILLGDTFHMMNLLLKWLAMRWNMVWRWGWKSKFVGKKERNGLEDKELYDKREEICLCVRKGNTILNGNVDYTIVVKI